MTRHLFDELLRRPTSRPVGKSSFCENREEMRAVLPECRSRSRSTSRTVWWFFTTLSHDPFSLVKRSGRTQERMAVKRSNGEIQMKKQIMCSVLIAAVAGSAMFAAANPSDLGIEDRFRAFVLAFNSGESELMMDYYQKTMTETAWNKRSKAERASMYERLFNDLGTIQMVGIELKTDADKRRADVVSNRIAQPLAEFFQKHKHGTGSTVFWIRWLIPKAASKSCSSTATMW